MRSQFPASPRSIAIALLVLGITGATAMNWRSRESRDPAAAAYTLKEYAAECELALGEIPTFNCLEGETIPVFNSDTGSEVTDSNHQGSSTLCDKPSLLRSNLVHRITSFNACVPYTRVGRSRASAGFSTEWIWTCRRYYTRSRNNPRFDDINMIGHNPKTGATCFFVSHINRTAPRQDHDRGWDGTKVPAIKSEEGMKFWSSPYNMTEVSAWRGGSQRCVECHDSDPWVHSPFIQQVKGADGKPLVPSHPQGPYFVVGSQYFNRDAWKLRYLGAPQAKACTSCHRIGFQRSCGEFAEWAAGWGQPTHISKAFARVPWMPAVPDWDLKRPVDGHHPAPLSGKAYEDAMKWIQSCCEKLDRPECRWTEMPKVSR